MRENGTPENKTYFANRAMRPIITQPLIPEIKKKGGDDGDEPVVFDD